jgi:hypothetical protein
MLSLGLAITSPAVWRNGAFVPSNAETAALLAAITGVYQNSLKQAWDDAIGALKTSGAWDDFDILYPIGAIPGTSAANATDSRLNWKNPSAFGLVAVNSMTHGSGYWQGDGSSARLRTQWTPATHGVAFQQNDASMWCWSLTDSIQNAYDIGNATITPITLMNIRDASSNIGTFVNRVTNKLSTAVAASTGMIGVQCRGATDNRNWRNGSQVGSTGTEATTGIPTQEAWVCGANGNQFGARRLSLAAWGASQEGREASIYSTLQTLFTAAGTI